MEQTSPRRDFAAESAAAQLESTPGRGAAGKRRIRSGGEGGNRKSKVRENARRLGQP